MSYATVIGESRTSQGQPTPKYLPELKKTF